MEPKCVHHFPRTFLPGGTVHSIRQRFRAANSWIIWLEDGVLATAWGDGAWQVPSFVRRPDASFLPETYLIDKLLDLEQVTQRFLHTAVRGG